MRSRLYTCHVMHARFHPKRHRFVYRMFMLGVDLDELPELHRRLRFFSVDRANLYSLRDGDFLPTTEPIHNQADGATTLPTKPPPLKQRVLDYLATHGIEAGPSPRVELITLPRMLGYRFNPVSFYFIRNTAGEAVAAICEVTNTFHEMKPYLLSGDTLSDGAYRLRTPKFFYVSPFSDVDVEFDFKLRIPDERLAVQIDDYTAGRRTLTSTLTGPSRPLTDATLLAFLFTYPLLTIRVIFLIHWHALRLWMRRVPWFAKAARPDDQRGLYRPHASLSNQAEDAQ